MHVNGNAFSHTIMRKIPWLKSKAEVNDKECNPVSANQIASSTSSVGVLNPKHYPYHHVVQRWFKASR